ncbi:OB-fold nucleic acid binding domain-containing protein [Specibacter cremeus]|uniref:OB-fold nucleic acid binding domain-containing protein n=1 Tax=Specibacter cremeus TaxID=1629051 RepID=UPI000F77F225|nr:OB-fold nucleic acid binding domain-containing protein [Specibacter cremeus]
MALQQGTWPAASPISELPVRGRVVCAGVIDAVTILPAAEKPAFTAIVSDYDAAPAPGGAVHRVRLVWLGRRRVPGIFAGTRLRLEGMVAPRDGLPTIFNPRYEIIGTQEG